jgi:hypothetical protein
MLAPWHIGAPVAFVAASMTLSTRSQDLSEVALTYLQRRGVPCLFVVQTDRTRLDIDMIARCQDGREWALLFLEGEVAFVDPRSRDLYRWQREVYRDYPALYATTFSAEDQTPTGD